MTSDQTFEEFKRQFDGFTTEEISAHFAFEDQMTEADTALTAPGDSRLRLLALEGVDWNFEVVFANHRFWRTEYLVLEAKRQEIQSAIESTKEELEA